MFSTGIADMNDFPTVFVPPPNPMLLTRFL